MTTPDGGHDALLGSPLLDVHGELQAVRRGLHEEFDDRLGPSVDDECLDRVAARFADARIRTYVPLLVRRYTREQLQARAAQAAPPSPVIATLPAQRSGGSAADGGADVPRARTPALGS